jgi:hypothetical protein
VINFHKENHQLMTEITKLYHYFNSILGHKFNPRDYSYDYKNAKPVPMLVLDNFLPDFIFKKLYIESQNIPDYLWTNFTRNMSNMQECKTLSESPVINTLTHCFNSGTFITWLEALTQKKQVISDPHLIGAGLSRCHRGNSLKLHTDFNWNDELRLNRTLSLIYYINPEWEQTWNGSLEFWNLEKTECVTKVIPKPNRLLIWDYDERLVHGYPDPLQCPEDKHRLNLRLFYYISNGTPSTAPHRSLYWWDQRTNSPIDNKNPNDP